jgi:hypothetical protein
MTIVRLPLQQYTPDKDRIEVGVYEGFVHLDVYLEGQGVERVSVSLLGDEARALAAMLDHQASELNR